MVTEGQTLFGPEKSTEPILAIAPMMLARLRGKQNFQEVHHALRPPHCPCAAQLPPSRVFAPPSLGCLPPKQSQATLHSNLWPTVTASERPPLTLLRTVAMPRCGRFMMGTIGIRHILALCYVRRLDCNSQKAELCLGHLCVLGTKCLTMTGADQGAVDVW